MSEAFRAVVRGRVQGVGYRQYTRFRALGFGLTGAVQNERDGTVTILAEGDRQQLELLIEDLRRGPHFAEVEDIEVTWVKAAGASGFTMR